MKNKSYRFLSLLLSILVLVSACICPAVANAGTVSEDKVYYVKSGGTGNGKTESTPAATVKDVIATIAGDGLGAGNTATIYILQRTDWNEYNGEKIGKINNVNTPQPHNLTTWSADGSAMTDHAFNIVVKSPEGQNNYLAYGGNLGENYKLTVGGNTVFDNVTLVAMRNELDQPLIMKGYNVHFTENFVFGYVDCTKHGTPAKVWDGTVKTTAPSFRTEMSDNIGNYTVPNAMTVTLDAKYDSSTGTKSANRKFFIGTSLSGGYSVQFKEDVNIVINNKDSYVPFQWGNTSGNQYSKVIFKKNLNLNIKDAKEIVNTAGGSTFKVNGGLQIIVDSDTTMTGLEDTLTAKGITSYWYLVNEADADVISFTETAGTFNVKRGYDVVVKDKDGIQVATGDSSNPLILPAGKYTFTATEKVYNYYVKSGGTGNGKTESTPAATVKDVITTIAGDGLVAGDTATIYILQRTDWNEYNGEAVGKINNVNTPQPHNLTTWSADGSAMTDHAFNIVVKSPEGQNNYLAYGGNLGENYKLSVGGNTVFDNVTLVAMRNELDQPLIMKGYNVHFTENFVFGYVDCTKHGTPAVWDGTVKTTAPSFRTEMSDNIGNYTVPNAMTVTLDAKYDSSTGTKDANRKFFIGTSLSGGYSVQFKEDVNIVINNKDSYVPFQWGNTSGNQYSKVIFKKNLNLNIKDAKEIVNTAGGSTFKVEGGLQIIADSDTTITDLETTLTAKGITSYWYLVNEADADVISFTETAGTFKVKDGAEVVVVKDGTTDEISPNEQGYFVLEAGKYTIKDSSGPKMLYFEATDRGPLQQRVTVENGKTYTYTFSLSESVSEKDIEVGAYHYSGRTNSIAIGTKKNAEDKGGYVEYTYEITMPEVMDSSDTFVGVNFKGTLPVKGYFFNAGLYKNEDTSKAEMFKNGNFANGCLDMWTWGFKDFRKTEDLGKKAFTSDDGKINLKVVLFDETLMPDLSDKAVYFSAQQVGPLNQQAKFVPNESYIFKFTISNNVKFTVGVFDNDSRGKSLDADVAYLNSVDMGKYSEYTYLIKMPDAINDDGNGNDNGLAFVGIRFTGNKPYEGYFTNASIYKASDATKTNIFKNGDFSTGYLNNWEWYYNLRGNAGTNVSEGTFTHADGDVYLKVVNFDEDSMTDSAPTVTGEADLMLHFNSTDDGPLYQIGKFEPNETYTYTFSLSDKIKDFSVDIYDNDIRNNKLSGATVTQVGVADKGGYIDYTYEIKMPDAINDDGNGNDNGLAFVGIKFTGSSSYEGYLFHVNLYKSSDADKTDILSNSNFAKGLDDLAWDWDVWFGNGSDADKKGIYSWNNAKTELEIVKYDRSLVPDLNEKMLHIVTNHKGPLNQQVTVEGGETYIYKFTASNNLKFDVVVVDNDRHHLSTKNVKVEFVEGKNKGKYATWTYKITMPETIISERTGEETNLVRVGVKLKGTAPYDGYFIDASFYRESDASATNQLKNSDFFSGELDNWTWKAKGLGKDQSKYETTEYADGKKDNGEDIYYNLSLEVVRFDESVMQDAAAKFPPKVPQMLHIVTDHAGPLGQLVSAKAGEKYTFEVAISNNVSFDVAVNHGDSRHVAINAKVDYVNCVDKGKYAVWTYTITMPDDLSAKTVLLGIKFKGPKPYDCYLTDAYLYNNADTAKENLFKNGNFALGELDGWKWKYENDTSGKSVFEEKFSDGEDSQKNPLYYNVKLEVMDFDESKMEKASAIKPDYSRKMIYFKNGAITQALSSWVDCKPGDKFIVSYSIFATDEVVPHFNRNGLRGNVNGNPELLSEVKTEIKPGYNYTTYTYRVTVPETYEDKLIFLGLKMPFYVEGYVFDIECYREGDANKKSAWRNGDFVYGLNDWIWGWTVTWFTQEGNQLKEWSDGMNEIKFVPFDLNQIVLLVDEINRDDGEWWKPTDIIEAEEEEQGIATIKGTFTDQDGKPIDKVKLILKSDNKTYTTFTDKKGAFVFKDIVADYYELYYVNSKGEEVSTSFSYGLSNGDTVTLKIVSDTTKRSKGAVSALKGTVYTASLETVSNLKVCLRGFGETVTDKDGNFSFGDVPVGMYELYTILEDGTEYVFRTVEIKENIDLGVKLKYDPQTAQAGSNQDLSFWIWIIIGCGAVVLVSGGLVTTLLILKKKRMVI